MNKQNKILVGLGIVGMLVFTSGLIITKFSDPAIGAPISTTGFSLTLLCVVAFAVKNTIMYNK